jgi:hypothetical protein
MGMTNDYPNLPGNFVQFVDGGYAVKKTNTDVTTNSLLLIGKSTDGYPLTPVACDIDTVESVFGSDLDVNGAYNGNELTRAFKVAYQTGCRDIRCLKESGSTATATLSGVTGSSVVQTRAIDTFGVTTAPTLAEGNAVTTINVSHPYIESSVNVFAQKLLLASSVLTLTAPTEITIAADVTDAGTPVTISYNYEQSQSQTDDLFVTSGAVALTQVPATSITSVTKGGIVVPEANYTLSAGKDSITITTYDGTTIPANGDLVEVIYLYDQLMQATESSDASGIFTTVSGTQVLTIQNTNAIVSDTFHLYDNGVEIMGTNFVVNYVAKTVSVDTSAISMGDILTGSMLIVDSTASTATLNLESVGANDLYNTATFQVVDDVNTTGTVIGKQIILTKPAFKKFQLNETPLTYNSSTYNTFADMVAAINADPMNNAFTAYTTFDDSNTSDLSVTPEAVFAGGDSGLTATNQEVYEALSGTRDSSGNLITLGVYQVLEDYVVDAVCLTGVYADSELGGIYQDFAQDLALFCAVLSFRVNTTIGWIATSPCNDTRATGIKAWVAAKVAYNNIHYMENTDGTPVKDSDGNYIDLGKFLNIVTMPQPLYFDNLAGTYVVNPAVAASGYDSILLAQSSMLNKTIPSCVGLSFKLSNPQMNAIAGNNMIVGNTKLLRGVTTYYFVNSVTSAIPGSQYAQTTTPKVLAVLSNDIREATDAYIGEDPTTENQNAMASALSKIFAARTLDGTVSYIGFQVIIAQAAQSLSEAQIELSATPPKVLGSITTVISLV